MLTNRVVKVVSSLIKSTDKKENKARTKSSGFFECDVIKSASRAEKRNENPTTIRANSINPETYNK